MRTRRSPPAPETQSSIWPWLHKPSTSELSGKRGDYPITDRPHHQRECYIKNSYSCLCSSTFLRNQQASATMHENRDHPDRGNGRAAVPSTKNPPAAVFFNRCETVRPPDQPMCKPPLTEKY